MDAPKKGNTNYRTVEVTATFLSLTDNKMARTMIAYGFESQHQAWNYFQQQVGHVSIFTQCPMYLSCISADNGDFILEAVPSYYSAGVGVLVTLTELA